MSRSFPTPNTKKKSHIHHGSYRDANHLHQSQLHESTMDDGELDRVRAPRATHLTCADAL